MASIFKATDLKTERTVALKVPFMQFESDPGFYSAIQARRADRQDAQSPLHPAHSRDRRRDQSRPYIVMEFLEGQTLGHLMRSVRPMPTSDALRIASLVCEAMHYMHEHEVVHRDLKPENIMICNDGSIRIMDFGIAKYEGHAPTDLRRIHARHGHARLHGPRAGQGQTRRSAARTSISLGAILYEMVTGRVPFEGANPFLIMNARLSGDPVAPRSEIPNCRRRSRRSSSTRWRAIRPNAIKPPWK